MPSCHWIVVDVILSVKLFIIWLNDNHRCKQTNNNNDDEDNNINLKLNNLWIRLPDDKQNTINLQRPLNYF